jgi:hypothetical protein
VICSEWYEARCEGVKQSGGEKVFASRERSKRQIPMQVYSKSSNVQSLSQRCDFSQNRSCLVGVNGSRIGYVALVLSCREISSR